MNKSRLKRCGASLLLLLLLLALWPTCAWAIDLKILSVAYDQHATPTESAPFTVVVKNNEGSTQFAEVDITLVNTETEAETTLTPVLTGNIPGGETLTLRDSYRIASGTYTVSFPLFDGNGVRVDRVQGKFPIHIGTATESLKVFPESIHLGSLPAGRRMHPLPITVSWSRFRFNRLRLDSPFSIRIYTDNSARFRGIPDAIRHPPAAGLISSNGWYTLPLKIYNLNYGPDIQEYGWDAALAGPPPVDDDDFWKGPPLLEGGRNLGSASWVRVPDISEMTSDPTSWRRLIGQDPFDTRFATDSNVTGDFTLKSPFTFYLATEVGPTAPEGIYSGTLIVELWSP